MPEGHPFEEHELVQEMLKLQEGSKETPMSAQAYLSIMPEICRTIRYTGQHLSKESLQILFIKPLHDVLPSISKDEMIELTGFAYALRNTIPNRTRFVQELDLQLFRQVIQLKDFLDQELDFMRLKIYKDLPPYDSANLRLKMIESGASKRIELDHIFDENN